MRKYVKGTLVQLSVVVQAYPSKTPVSPSAIALRVRLPSGVIVDISAGILNDGVGLYHATYITANAGLHEYEWECTGVIQVANKSQFLVLAGIP